MATQQHRMVEQIERRLDDAGLERSTSTGWANQVTIRAFERGSPTQLFHVYLDFQRAYVTGGVFLEGDQIVNNWPYRTVGGRSEVIHERSFNAHYSQDHSVTHLFEVVDDQIRSTLRNRLVNDVDDVLDALVGEMDADAALEVVTDALRRFVAEDSLRAGGLLKSIEAAREAAKAVEPKVPAPRP